MFKPSYTTAYAFQGVTDPRAILDTAAWAGNRFYVLSITIC